MKLVPLRGIPLVREGDDIGELVVEALKRNRVSLQHGDVVVVAQTIVSKAEGRVVELKEIKPSTLAKRLARASGKDARVVEVILRESSEILRASHVLITRTTHGFICANAGIDRSNVGRGRVTLLPADPDSSARRIRRRIKELLGVDVAVIISDTQGRAFRVGCVGVAIGVAGMRPLLNLQGRKDLYNKRLESTVIASADALAAAAVLVMGEANESTPVVVIKEAPYERGVGEAKQLVRPREQDLFGQ